jgi:hypothetical protein
MSNAVMVVLEMAPFWLSLKMFVARQLINCQTRLF